MKIWIVLHEENAGHESDVFGVYSSEEKANEARDSINRLAIAAGESCYTDPDDADYEGPADWEHDFTIAGPIEVDAPPSDAYGWGRS